MVEPQRATSLADKHPQPAAVASRHENLTKLVDLKRSSCQASHCRLGLDDVRDELLHVRIMEGDTHASVPVDVPLYHSPEVPVNMPDVEDGRVTRNASVAPAPGSTVDRRKSKLIHGNIP